MQDIFPLNILSNPFKMYSFCTNSSCICFLWIFMEVAALLCKMCMEGILNYSLGQSHWHYSVPHCPSGQGRGGSWGSWEPPWAAEVSCQMHINVLNNSMYPGREHQACPSGCSISRQWQRNDRTTAIRHELGLGVLGAAPKRPLEAFFCNCFKTLAM